MQKLNAGNLTSANKHIRSRWGIYFFQSTEAYAILIIVIMMTLNPRFLKLRDKSM